MRRRWSSCSGCVRRLGVNGTREEWAGAAARRSGWSTSASAVQDAAIARLAAIEPEFLEDGTVVECHGGWGTWRWTAPAIVSGALNVSAVHAERRVRTAVRLAADGPAGSATETGLGGLHDGDGAGRLDAYRAGVVAEELEHAPREVAATVIAALEGHFDTEDGAHLRRRCRRVLTRISPDLLRQRAARARAKCGLRRWADEPGVDRWEGTFPSEEAARAWAAIDALAQPVRHRRRLPGHRTRPREGVDRPGRRQRHHRHVRQSPSPSPPPPSADRPPPTRAAAAPARRPGHGHRRRRRARHRAVADATLGAGDDEPKPPETPGRRSRS